MTAPGFASAPLRRDLLPLLPQVDPRPMRDPGASCALQHLLAGLPCDGDARPACVRRPGTFLLTP
ncbi:MAG: hypothetical protein ACK52I_16525 [Pseudomonadota bacterium]|jgi:hypothetical protein